MNSAGYGSKQTVINKLFSDLHQPEVKTGSLIKIEEGMLHEVNTNRTTSRQL